VRSTDARGIVAMLVGWPGLDYRVDRFASEGCLSLGSKQLRLSSAEE
jgi:hypothetical protein